MATYSLINRLGFSDRWIEASNAGDYSPEYADIANLGVDKVYFSGKYPAAFFLKVDDFDSHTLQRIAKIREKVWNYRRVLLLFTYTTTEVRIYNCFEKPVFFNQTNINESLSSVELLQVSNISPEQDLNLLSEVFSRIGVDSGLIWQDERTRNKIRIENRLDKFLARSLGKAADKLKVKGLDMDTIHALLIRSLFILFLEDKGAADEAGLYEKIKKGCHSYLDILEDKTATYQLFRELQHHFNSNITPLVNNEENNVTTDHLEIVKQCFTDGDFSKNPSLFEKWRIFDFHIIQVELLSEIYEVFLGELRALKGQYFTPHSLVDLILSDKLPTNNSEYNVRILDPACGSGIFLVESFRRLIIRWKRSNNRDTIPFEDLKNLLIDNIFGIEIDPTAIRVAALSLYIALIDELNPKTLWIEDNYKLPYLIKCSNNSDYPQKGKNLFLMDTIVEATKQMFPQIDLVVGNPPYGKKNLPNSIKKYCKKEKFANEYVLPFIHKATILAPEGEIAFIFNTKVLTNTEKPYCKFRKWLFNANYVQRIYNLSILRKAPKEFGGQLFSEATVPVCIMYFTPAKPIIESNTLEYWAPQTYLRSNIIDGVVIANADIKQLPRIECNDPNSKIWKIAHWGNFRSFRFYKQFTKVYNSLGYYIHNTDGWIEGRGLNADSQNPDFVPSILIDTKRIDRYYTREDNVKIINTRHYRKNKENLFVPPFVLFKEGQHNTEIACTLFTKPWYCNTSAYAINGGTVKDKKFLVAYLNSDIVKFILFLTASSWGIERERVLLNELLSVPSPFVSGYEKEIDGIVASFDNIVKIKQTIVYDESQIKEEEKNIFKSFVRLFGISIEDELLINDTLRYSLGLFKDGHKSECLHRSTGNENKKYAELLCKHLDYFMRHSELKFSAYYFDPNPTDALNMVIVEIGEKPNSISLSNESDYREILSEIDKHTIEKKTDSIYIQKSLLYYSNNRIYIIRPNQKRFWTQSQAIDDATSIISEVISMVKIWEKD